MLPVCAVYRVTAVTDGRGTTEADFDAFGRVVRTIAPGYQGARVFPGREHGNLPSPGFFTRQAPGAASSRGQYQTRGWLNTAFDALGRFWSSKATRWQLRFIPLGNVRQRRTPNAASWAGDLTAAAVAAVAHVDAKGDTDGTVQRFSRQDPISNIEQNKNHQSRYNENHQVRRFLRRMTGSTLAIARMAHFRRLQRASFALVRSGHGRSTRSSGARATSWESPPDSNTVSGGRQDDFDYDDFGRIAVSSRRGRRQGRVGSSNLPGNADRTKWVGLSNSLSRRASSFTTATRRSMQFRTRGLLNTIVRTVTNNEPGRAFATTFLYDGFAPLRIASSIRALPGEAFAVRSCHDEAGNRWCCR